MCLCACKFLPPVGRAAAPARWGYRRSPQGTEQGGAPLPTPYWSHWHWEEESCCWSYCWPADALDRQIKGDGREIMNCPTFSTCHIYDFRLHIERKGLLNIKKREIKRKRREKGWWKEWLGFTSNKYTRTAETAVANTNKEMDGEQKSERGGIKCEILSMLMFPFHHKNVLSLNEMCISFSGLIWMFQVFWSISPCIPYALFPSTSQEKPAHFTL